MAIAKAIPYAIWGGSELVGSSAMFFTDSNEPWPPFQRIESSVCQRLFYAITSAKGSSRRTSASGISNMVALSSM